ncbi:MAG: hypothetical protein L3K19_01255 [Thermoplasmata archaeon]|nr:hypothetical protein [Thermoplasmata archaeon]
MEKSCPECGAQVEFVPTAAQMQTGTCSGCQHTILILSAGGPPLVAEAPAVSAEEGSMPPSIEVKCPECGSATELSLKGRGAISAECDVCDRTFVFKLQRTGAPEEVTEREERPAFRARPRDDDRGGDRRGGGAERARPCRECGGPLRFETNEDGGVTGICDSCGNRFTLPRRSPDGGRGERGGSRGFSSYGRGRPGGFRSSGRPPSRGGFSDRRGPPRRRERRDDSD